MRKGDPQVVRWALKKMIHLEQDPEAGDALLGGLTGWRKISVGDRDWRLVWRVTYDEGGASIVHVAEVWAYGARSDAEVYAEMEGRIATAPTTPQTRALLTCSTPLDGSAAASARHLSPQHVDRLRRGCGSPCCTWSGFQPLRSTRWTRRRPRRCGPTTSPVKEADQTASHRAGPVARSRIVSSGAWARW
jgi:hypothetical protein